MRKNLRTKALAVQSDRLGHATIPCHSPSIDWSARGSFNLLDLWTHYGAVVVRHREIVRDSYPAEAYAKSLWEWQPHEPCWNGTVAVWRPSDTKRRFINGSGSGGQCGNILLYSKFSYSFALSQIVKSRGAR